MMRTWTGASASRGRRWFLLLAAACLACSLLLPPLIAFVPQPLSALGLVLLGAAAALIPWPSVVRRWIHAGGAVVMWGVVAWCDFSQAAPLTEPRGRVWGERALPLALALAVWLWLQAPQLWQRRTLLALTLPSLCGLSAMAWPTPRQVLDFAPYYVAVDAHQTIYVSDAHASVIRVFGADGSLRAKLRPGLASLHGPPGIGFSPPGAYNDPDSLGVGRALPGSSSVSALLRPWPVGADDFWFCGMATDSASRLYVPDWMRGRMLRFTPGGTLDADWPLPSGYQPSLGCISAAGSTLLLSDQRGAVLQIDPLTHKTLHSWSLPETIEGGISATSRGDTVFALAASRVYRIDTRSGAVTSWPLPTPTGPLGAPYQAILALGDGRVVIANLTARRADLYSGDGRPLGAVGRHGHMPGEFGQVGGLATDAGGHIYVSDVDSRALQRFTPTGHIDAIYWGPDDDEVD
jgi:hypothetical protein